MKSWIVLGLLVSGVVWGQSEVEIQDEAGNTRLKGYRMGACDYWQMLNSNNGFTYGCGIFPTRIVVADGYDVADAFTAAEKRILALEQKVAELEKKVNGPKNPSADSQTPE